MWGALIWTWTVALPSAAAWLINIERVPVQVLSGKLDGKDQEQVWLDACNASFAAMIKDKQSREAEEAKATVQTSPQLSHCNHRRACPCVMRGCCHADRAPRCRSHAAVINTTTCCAHHVLLPARLLSHFSCTLKLQWHTHRGHQLTSAVSAQDSKSVTQPDELIDFIHLKSRRGLTQLELEDEVATDLQKATGLVDTSAANSANLNRVLQLTGQSLS